MITYEPKNIRNVALLGHQGSGKTSLLESIAFIAGLVKKKGTVEEGNTISDYLKEEKNHKISYKNSLVPVEYQGFKYNFIDTPGLFDFGVEVDGALRAARIALIVVDATKGVEAGTKKAYRYVRERSIPAIVVVTKMDKQNINYDKTLEEVRDTLGKRVVPFTWPIGRKEDFEGFVNAIDETARIYNGKECVDAPVWEEKLPKVKMLHEKIVESVAEIDDALTERFLMEEPIELHEIKDSLRMGIKTGQLVPMICISSQKDVGIHSLLRIIAEYMPSVADNRQPFGESIEHFEIQERRVARDELLSAIIFKTDIDPFVGKINYVMVRSGVLRKGMTINNPRQGTKDTIANLYFLRGKEQIETDEISAGDIGVITKTSSLNTGDTICDEKDSFVYNTIDPIAPTIFYALVVKDKKDESKIGDALKKMCLEDLSITTERNPETKQLVLGCQGSNHLEYIIEKLRNVYGVNVEIEPAKISYRETIKGRVEAEGRYVKQSGGSGQYGIVQMRFEPSDTEEPSFTEEIYGGAVPGGYIPAVEKGFREACLTGVLKGYPVVNIKATLYDGKYHPVDSSELAFKMAAIMSFKEALPKARPVLLEPVMLVKVTAPTEYVGDIIGDINKRRGIVEGMEVLETEQVIIAQVPQAELATYILDLNAMTQAQASFTMSFSCYQEVPSHLVDKIQ